MDPANNPFHHRLFSAWRSFTNQLLFAVDPARVVYSPTIQYLPLGLSGVVRCFIQASPPTSLVTWTKDRRGWSFDPSTQSDVELLSNGSLLFSKVTHEHQGVYRCNAYNVHGSSGPSQGMEVLVRGKLIITTAQHIDWLLLLALLCDALLVANRSEFSAAQFVVALASICPLHA